jgi:pyruvate dehydrogenase E1 component
MLQTKVEVQSDANPQETGEWLESLDSLIEEEGPERAAYLLDRLADRAALYGIANTHSLVTPYINTIPVDEEVPYPGERAIERRIKSLVRWNAMAMVVRANKYDPGIGGHISTYASLATLLEVGHNHFFHARYGDQPGDLVYFQGHASPGVYARAYLEGRLTEKHLENFRHELRGEPGLSSYPHPWLMPDFWQFPTVSMGLGPINAIYQARFMRYLENRGIIPATPRHIWAFVGDGETDEPESLGAITLPPREKLDNLIFVVNCNLQRLDGPVRGNGKIISELEGDFRGAGWNVIKVLWRQLGRASRPRHHRPVDEAHGGVRRRRISEFQSQRWRLHSEGILRKISRGAKTGRAYDRRRGRQAAPRRPRSAKSLQRLQARG